MNTLHYWCHILYCIIPFRDATRICSGNPLMQEVIFKCLCLSVNFCCPLASYQFGLNLLFPTQNVFSLGWNEITVGASMTWEGNLFQFTITVLLNACLRISDYSLGLKSLYFLEAEFPLVMLLVYFMNSIVAVLSNSLSYL